MEVVPRVHGGARVYGSAPGAWSGTASTQPSRGYGLRAYGGARRPTRRNEDVLLNAPCANGCL